ncbi:unnamed protein product [Spirodela intermedia]|uniref:GAG-pre-integrase domain-containing protein n=1 Tax=Spirodela intermedia TaxID=51605 RepID=A0A7I8K7S4_SPIIN|nr:unnamed protein product [Spirodela intermedia]
MKRQRCGTLYILLGTTIVVASISMIEEDVTKLWHIKLGHICKKGINLLSKRGLLCGKSTSKVEFCEHCILGKHKSVSFQMTTHKTKSTIDYIHLDLWGLSRIPSKGAAHYFLSFIDIFS